MASLLISVMDAACPFIPITPADAIALSLMLPCCPCLVGPMARARPLANNREIRCMMLVVRGPLVCFSGRAGPVTSSPTWMLQPCKNGRSRFWSSRHAVLPQPHTHICTASYVPLSGYVDRIPLLEGLPLSPGPRAVCAAAFLEMSGCVEVLSQTQEALASSLLTFAART